MNTEKRRRGRVAGLLGRWLPRRVVVAVLVLGLLGAWLQPVASPAMADGLCSDPPKPVTPVFGWVGLVTSAPNMAKVPDVAPNPFAGTKVPIADVYGYSFRYTNYDLGCGNDMLRDPWAVTTTAIANQMITLLDAEVAVLAGLEHLSNGLNLDWAKPAIATIGSKLSPAVLGVWMPLALLVVAILVGVGAARASYAETMRRLAVVAGCVALGVFSLLMPRYAADVMDKGAQTVASVTSSTFPTDASDLIMRNTLYPTWLVGNFGSATSPVAVEYGPQLMDAQTYSWSDMKRLQDPKAKKAIDKAKGKQYEKIASEVEDKDPMAYQSLTGKTDTRMISTMMGFGWVTLMGLFVAIASLITIMARILMLGLVVAAMLGAVVGLVSFSFLQRLWDLFTAALLAVAKFTLASGIMTLVLGAIQAAPVGALTKMVFAVAVTVAAIMLTKPIASFKSMVGMNPNSHKLSGFLRSAAGSALGTLFGLTTKGGRLPTPPEPEKETSTGLVAVQSQDAPLPPLPDPVWTQSPGPGEPRPRTWPQDARPPHAALPPTPARWEGAAQWATSQQPVSSRRHEPLAAPTRRELGAGPSRSESGASTQETSERPVVSEHAQYGQPAVGPAPSAPAVGPSTTVVGGPVTVVPADSASAAAPAAQPAISSLDGTVAPPTAASSTSRPRSGGEGEEIPIVYPTGVIVQVEPDPSLYRTGQSVAHTEYVKMPEPQIDANGEETWEPMYRSKART